MTRSEMSHILLSCTYKPGWTLLIDMCAPRPYIQWEVVGQDSVTREPTSWRTGKRYLSEHMCRQEVVATAFNLALTAEEHECREWFRYKGSSIYNPHLDPDVLADVASKAASFNVRANAMLPE